MSDIISDKKLIKRNYLFSFLVCVSYAVVSFFINFNSEISNVFIRSFFLVLFLSIIITTIITGISYFFSKDKVLSVLFSIKFKWVSLYLSVILTLSTNILASFISELTFVIEPGQKGVIETKYGEVKIFNPGIHTIAPWKDMIVYDVKETETYETMEVLDKTGLSIKIDLSIIHHPISDKIGDFHKNIGENYLEEIIKPTVRSVTREVIVNYFAEEIYNTIRTEVEFEIYLKTSEILISKNINIPAIYIRDVTLP